MGKKGVKLRVSRTICKRYAGAAEPAARNFMEARSVNVDFESGMIILTTTGELGRERWHKQSGRVDSFYISLKSAYWKCRMTGISGGDQHET
jgi:hypothetical protein